MSLKYIVRSEDVTERTPNVLVLLPDLSLDTILVALDALDSDNPLLLSEERRRHRVVGESEVEQQEYSDREQALNNHKPLPLVGGGLGVCVVYTKRQE